MTRRLGFNYRRAVRKLNPELAAKLYPTAPLPRDVQDRLAEIAGEIDALNWYSDAQLASEQLVRLTDERRRLRAALAKVGLKRRPDRHATTEKRGKPG